MKTQLKITVLLLSLSVFFTSFGQGKRDLDNYRQPDQRGINVFEAPKDSISTFDGINVRIGGQSTLQFQALDHENSGAVPLKDIGYNFNLATANLDLDVALAKGVRMHLRTYLSSRHHPEPYVKGGYLQIDNLDFVSEGFMSGFMKYATLKVGHMENNYGDAHFRRSDNAQALYNPFVKYRGLEFFGTFENSTGRANNELEDRTATQLAGELIYRFGQNEKFYVGTRYNKVDSEEANGDEIEITRFNLSAGWFLTRNILAKLEYVSQKHDGYNSNSIFNDGKFDGLMLETVISF